METRNYYIITPYESTFRNFDKVWEFDKNNNTIAIGWTYLGDPKNLTKEQLIEKSKNTEKPISKIAANMIASFTNIKIGDRILVRKGRSKCLAIGEVIKESYYDLIKGDERKLYANTEYNFANFIDVKWEDKIKEYELPVFAISTIYQIDQDKYENFIDDKVEAMELNNIFDNESTIDTTSFILEKYLQDFITSNFRKIFGDNVDIFIDKDGIKGDQYNTGNAGIMDILAFDKANNKFIIIELKRNKSSDIVVGQILRYIGWVEENLCNNEEKIEGIIICGEGDVRLQYAIKPVSSFVKLKYYKIDFRLSDNI